MTRGKRKVVRMPLDLSPEQHEALMEYLASLPDKTTQGALRRILGEHYKAKTGKPWPPDPIVGNQKVRED